jgi:zinc transport system substrate-binding protein
MKFLKIFLLSLAIISNACAQSSSSKKPIIATSISPIHQIALAISKDAKNTILIIKPNFSEHEYQLKKSDVAAIYNADLFFYVDDNLEKNLAKLAKKNKSYQLSKINGIKLLPNNYHLWLDLQNALKIAEFITQKICEIDSANCKNYQKNLEEFGKKINQTSKKLRANLSKINNTNYAFYHSGYQYFIDYFNLKPLTTISQNSSNNHEQELSLKELRAFTKILKTNKVKCIFSDALDEKNSGIRLAKNHQIKFATLNLISAEGDYFQTITEISEKITGCLAL